MTDAAEPNTETRELHRAFQLIGQHPAERVYNHQAITSDVYLRGDAPPTRRQVAAVLHALADYTHQKHMLGEHVAGLGRDRYTEHDHAAGLGRYFHALGDWLGGSFTGTSVANYVEARATRR